MPQHPDRAAQDGGILSYLVQGEVQVLQEQIIAESEKYDQIVKEWLKQKPQYEQKIKQYTDRITALKNQIEQLIMERINDREYAETYNTMIAKREQEITDLERKIEESRQFDEVSRRKRDELKSTAEMLEDMLSEPKISDANLRLLLKKVYVHQNEDKSIEVRFEFNGDFADSLITLFKPTEKVTA